MLWGSWHSWYLAVIATLGFLCVCVFALRYVWCFSTVRWEMFCLRHSAHPDSAKTMFFLRGNKNRLKLLFCEFSGLNFMITTCLMLQSYNDDLCLEADAELVKYKMTN